MWRASLWLIFLVNNQEPKRNNKNCPNVYMQGLLHNAT
jgi:hypothetical protein